MSDITIDPKQYIIKDEPYFEPVANEIALYEAAYNARMPMMLKGPTGCGKSRFVEHMAWKLGRPLITVACNEDMTASDLVGRFLLDKDGTKWQDGPLTTAARMGAICYLDEVVEARQDTTVVIHPLTDHRRTLPLDKKGELVEAHPQRVTFWRTVGLAAYRSEEWTDAIEALSKARQLTDELNHPTLVVPEGQLTANGLGSELFLLAMSHWQLDERDQALNWFDKAVKSIQENQPENEELHRFRTEAAELLGIPGYSKEIPTEQQQ